MEILVMAPADTWSTLLAAAGFSLALCFALAPLARRIGLVDHPTGHKVHNSQVPLVGGRYLIRRAWLRKLYRTLDPEGAPVSWGLRLFNGAGEQQLTIFLPNPFLDDEGRVCDEPDWSRLALWDELRARHLGCGPDERDRSARRFFHA